VKKTFSKIENKKSYSHDTEAHSFFSTFTPTYSLSRYIDEQSGFTAGRRHQTKNLSLVENLRLTVAACNRLAL